MKLRDVAFHGVDRSLIPDDPKSLPRASRRLMEILVKGSPTPTESAAKAWSLDSCLSPKHFLGNGDAPSSVASTEFTATKLTTPFDPQSSVEATDETLVLPSDVVFRSVGYKSTALPGFAEAGIQFDERRGVLDNDGLGRVTRMVSNEQARDVETRRIPGLYCAGWVKRGPTGVIASTMQDAFITGDALVSDWLAGAPFLSNKGEQSVGGWDAVAQEAGLTSASKAVAWDDWRKIDQAERERGRSKGKEREKFARTADMLAVLG